MFAGITACLTIVGIPLGIQLFKMSGYVIWPFGRKLIEKKTNGFKQLLNIIWAVLMGWFFALGFIFTGLIFFITIIGIPFRETYKTI